MVMSAVSVPVEEVHDLVQHVQQEEAQAEHHLSVLPVLRGNPPSARGECAPSTWTAGRRLRSTATWTERAAIAGGPDWRSTRGEVPPEDWRLQGSRSRKLSIRSDSS